MTGGNFILEYIPTLFDNYSIQLQDDESHYDVSLWDTAGQDDYDRLRPLSYPQTDVFYMCFAVNSEHSFQLLRTKFYPEVKQVVPNPRMFLLDLKSDLRAEEQCVAKEDA